MAREGLPEGWEWSTLGEVADPNSRAIVSGPFGSNIGSRFFVEEGVPVIRGNNLTTNTTRFVDGGFVFVTEGKADELGNCEAIIDDLVFTAAGSLGQVGIIPKSAKYPRYIISNKQLRARIDKRKVDPLFAFYWFASKEMVEYVQQRNTGSSVPLINLSVLRSLPLPVPPLAEQRAIAHVLGTLDGKIELNRRMNETLEAIARAIFKSWFVDFDSVRAKAEGRDPGLPKPLADLFPDSFEDSQVGGIPRGWSVAPLPTVIEVNPSRSLPRGEVAPYLDMANMPTRGHSPDLVIQRPFGSGMRFANGDTLVARITPCLENGKTAYVDFLEEGQVGWGSTEYIVLRPKAHLPAEYAYCLARSDEFRDFAIQSMTGSSGRQRVPAESLSHFLVVSPSGPVAELFGKLVKPLFARARRGAEEGRTLATLRDTLLPKLISGELRVKHPARLPEGVVA
jgi:type I restriction enzyme S subunit